MPDISLVRRLVGSLRTRAFERDMSAEIASHLEFEADALVARGWTPADARTEARRRFGSVAATADLCRDSWGLRAIDAVRQDVRHACRVVVQARGNTILMLLTLAAGIGITTAIFSAVNAVLLRRLPHASGESLVEIRQQNAGDSVANIGLSLPELADYRRRLSSLDALVEYHQMWFNLIEKGAASRVMTGVVSAEFFDVIGVKPILGRTFSPEDDAPDAAPVLVLSHAYWQKALGADPRIVGRTVEMNDKVHRVVGVLPEVPQFPEDAEHNDVYMPVSACPFHERAVAADDRRMRIVSVIGRIRTGSSLDAVRRELADASARMAGAHPTAYPAGFSTSAESVREELTARARPTLTALMGASLCVLLLVCANVANLALARLVPREHELKLRGALGASPGRLARQLFVEAATLAAAGGTLGLGLAALARAWLSSYALRFTPRAAEISIDRTVVLFAVGITVVTAIIFGLVPVWRVARAPDTLGRRAASRTLIVPQVAISFVLLAVSLQMTRNLVALLTSDPGFTSDHVLTARVDLDWARYATDDERRAFYRTLLARMEAAPGTKNAALSLTFPLNGAEPYRARLLAGNGDRNPAASRPIDLRLASPGYFAAVGMTVLRGRGFTASDSQASPPVALVNRSMARRHFGDADPVGRRVSLDAGRSWIAVVGLVNDVKQYGLDQPVVDEIYLPFDQRAPLSATMILRTAGDPMSARRSAEDLVRSIDPRQPVSRAQTLDTVRDSSMAPMRTTTALVTWLATVALFIAAAGVTGAVWFSVNQRRREIGVRIALGESPAHVAFRVFRDGLAPVAAGLACGIPAALAVAPWIGGAGEASGPAGPGTIIVGLVTVVAVATLACAAPARRAASINPVDALRTE